MSSQIKNFVEECRVHYGECLLDLPDFVQHEFAALIMSQDEGYASEANGPDNRHWDTKMLPALLSYLKNSTDRDEAIEFNSIWVDCVTDYVSKKMQDLLEGGNFHD